MSQTVSSPRMDYELVERLLNTDKKQLTPALRSLQAYLKSPRHSELTDSHRSRILKELFPDG